MNGGNNAFPLWIGLVFDAEVLVEELLKIVEFDGLRRFAFRLGREFVGNKWE